jgi:ribosomal-protein-alanine N-acetyltransferase
VPTIPDLDRVGRIDSVAVLPEFRQQGLGTEIMRWALQRFAERGLKNALLQVRLSNQAALRIYRSLGFAVVAKQALWQINL